MLDQELGREGLCALTGQLGPELMLSSSSGAHGVCVCVCCTCSTAAAGLQRKHDGCQGSDLPPHHGGSTRTLTHPSFSSLLQANVVCVVYDVTKEVTIEKVTCSPPGPAAPGSVWGLRLLLRGRLSTAQACSHTGNRLPALGATGLSHPSSGIQHPRVCSACCCGGTPGSRWLQGPADSYGARAGSCLSLPRLL